MGAQFGFQTGSGNADSFPHPASPRFCAPQQPLMEELMAWVRQQRALRKQVRVSQQGEGEGRGHSKAGGVWQQRTLRSRCESVSAFQ